MRGKKERGSRKVLIYICMEEIECDAFADSEIDIEEPEDTVSEEALSILDRTSYVWRIN